MPHVLTELSAPDTDLYRLESRDVLYKEYRKLLIFIGVWVMAVMVAVFTINAPPADPLWQRPDYTSKWGYTWSLALLLMPLAFLIRWYQTNRDEKQLRPLMRALLLNIGATAGVWILLDIFLANLLFVFPDQNAHWLPMVWGYSWKGACGTLATVADASCYPRNIPLEEFVFYLAGTGLLSMMYMWASEDFYESYTIPRPVYEQHAKLAPPLIKWNKTLVLSGLAVLAAGLMVKKFGWWPHDPTGLPYYLFAELAIVFLPLSAVYTNVHRFTNPRAFMFVLILHVLVSLVWEVTLALPLGWWGYQDHAMAGITITPWSNLAIEACGLWLSVGWASMFIYETTKIKVLSGRTWLEVLRGPRPVGTTTAP